MLNLDLVKLRAKFVTIEGGKVTEQAEPGDDAVFLIAGGTWPNEACAGVRRALCKACGCAVGLSPKSWEYHQRNRLRPIVCGDCFLMMAELEAALAQVTS